MIPSIRKYKSKKKLDKIPKSISNLQFESIKSVGILFHMNDVSLLKEIEEIKTSNFLKEKNVAIICYFEPSKKNPTPETDGIIFIQKKDFDKNYNPISNESIQFINQEYDLFLDLTVNYDHRTHVISVLSKAKFKAGLYHKKQQHIHFNIKLEETTPVILFDELIHYLGKLF